MLMKKNNEKKIVVSFDTLVLQGEKVEVPTIYNILNAGYSDKVVQQLPDNMLDITVRRAALEDIFSNRVKFLVQNAVSSILTEPLTFFNISTSIDTDAYSYIFNVHSYMGATESVVLDFTSVLCSAVYNAHVKVAGLGQDEEHYNELMHTMKIIYDNIYSALVIVYKEANTIYLAAGVPEMNCIDEE